MKKILISLPSCAMFIILSLPFLFANSIPHGVLIVSSIFLLWLFFVGNALKEKAKTFKNISIKLFNASLIYAFTYIFIIELVFKNIKPKLALPFHLLGTLCIFGALFFVSKLLVISEEKKIDVLEHLFCFGFSISEYGLFIRVLKKC